MSTMEKKELGQEESELIKILGRESHRSLPGLLDLVATGCHFSNCAM